MKAEISLCQTHLFPADKVVFSIAKELYDEIVSLPIISPHGHTNPAWFSENKNFSNPTDLFITSDHYILRMLYSQGVRYDELGVNKLDQKCNVCPRSVWRLFAKNYYIFLGTPSKLWIDYSLAVIFDINESLSENTADKIYDKISNKLRNSDFLPRSLLNKLNVEVIATTEFALDSLIHHKKMLNDGFIGKVITTYRPDDVTDPENKNCAKNILKFGEITGEDTTKWHGLLNAHRKRREEFRKFGATSTDHAVPTLQTIDLSISEKQKLLDKVLNNLIDINDAEIFRAQMLTEMAMLSVEDGMVMQIHAGSKRNTSSFLLSEYGENLGADIPLPLNCVNGLEILLNKYGNERTFRLIVFVLDESVYSRELAPMAGYWPALTIGPPWWFHDSSQGIRRYLNQVVETAGFYNLAGFNDDTRALLSIPARHDMWRREICRFLALLVSECKISKYDARNVAKYLSYQAAKNSYKL